MTALLSELLDCFPHDDLRDVQADALEFIASKKGRALLEIPTGEGKTAVGFTVARRYGLKSDGPVFYVTPTKAQVEQVVNMFPEGTVRALGRAEFPCLYYADRGADGVTAEASPCYLLRCGHRLDPETGQAVDDGAEPCPYFRQKRDALEASKERGMVIVTTTAFFLVNRLAVAAWRDEEPGMTVLDEAHKLPQVARRLFERTVTDVHLLECARRLSKVGARGLARQIAAFVQVFRRIARKRPSLTPSLLAEPELESLLATLKGIDNAAFENAVREAIASGAIDPVADREELKSLEDLTRGIPRMIRSLELSTELLGIRPLNYVVAFYFKKDDPGFAGTRKRAQYVLTLKSYYVAPVIRKAAGEKAVAYSATIGEPRIFGYETGLELPFMSATSSFDVRKTKVWMPTDTPNLSVRMRRRNDLNRSLRLIVRSAERFAKEGHRSLVVVVSDDERHKFLEFASEAGLATVSYGNGVKARDAATAFLAGEGTVLVGTSAQYAEGIDLPAGTAPVIFFLRPGYQRPDDPQTQFEERRFSEGECWAIWNWRVMMEALQVRGRNIRSAEDVGVCFFISQQFKRFLFGALPRWLRPAYGQATMEEAVMQTLKLLGR